MVRRAHLEETVMNKIIIGKREIGKTTHLLSHANKQIKNGNNVAILDSATEHKNKSLIFKFLNEHENCHLICPKTTEDIVPSFSDNYYKKCLNSNLFKEMITNVNKTLCIDLSYFLELGYTLKEKSNSEELFAVNRQLYNDLSQQVATCLMGLVNENYLSTLKVFSDEIEFPISRLDISQYQDCTKIQFLAAVHQENSKGTFYKSFKPANFVPYNIEAKNDNI